MRDLTPFAPDPNEIASWRRVGEQVEARLAASGIPPCEWLPLQSNLTLAAFREHARTCRSCAERDRIAAEYERDEPPDSLAAPNLGVGRLAAVVTGVLAVGAGAVALLDMTAGVSPLRSIPIVGLNDSSSTEALMPPRIRFFFSMMSVMFFFMAAVPLYTELSRRSDIWWTPQTMLVPLAESTDRVEIYARGRLLARGQIRVAEDAGTSVLIPSEVGLRFNNWDRVRAQRVPVVLASGAGCGMALLMFLLVVSGRLAYRGEKGDVEP
jgi:hypothetical protein